MKFYKLIILTVLYVSCATNPYTGKKTMALKGNDELFAASFKQYDQFITSNKVVTDTKDAEMIHRVGKRISNAAKVWLDSKGYQGYLDKYEWEYNLIDDKTENAWCMPGGKIVFYTGILPTALTEDGVATIVGHEVAHALANHGQQRSSAGTLQKVGALGVLVATSDKSATDQALWLGGYSAATQVGGMLPFSRKHETEADEIGIYLMAIAGYNPEEAPKLWKRMQDKSKGSSSDILSTHPSDTKRIQNLTNLVDKAKAEALKYK